MATLKTITENLNSLRSAFGADIATQKKQLLDNLNEGNFSSNYHDLIACHEQLLFLLTYPDNKQVLKLAQKTLTEISEHLEVLASSAPQKFHTKFKGTGIAHSEVGWNPSYDACCWLVKCFGADVSLVWSDEFMEKLGPFITAFADALEQDGLVDNRFDVKDWLMMASGSNDGADGKDLQWLLRHFENLKCDVKTRDLLFETLAIEIILKLNSSTLSRTGNILKNPKPFFQSDGLLKSFDSFSKINEPLKSFKEIRGIARKIILNSSKSVLVARERETDPVFYAQKIYLAEVERGLDVYLFMMDKEHRLPVENYAGFVAYRNGVPIGYGGGWMFIERCEIGVNIFETFRGGENNLIFTNIMRVYNQVFDVSRFVVPPYQFGEDNEEGLQSGAFWFYYKLGYRPADTKIRAMAEKEWTKITTKKGYRSAISILKKFTECPLEFTHKKSQFHFEPKQMSVAVTNYVAQKFNGNQTLANAWSMNILKTFAGVENYKKWPVTEKHTFNYLSILIASLPSNFSKSEQQSIVNLFRKKGSDELAFSKELKHEVKFLKAVEEFIKKYDYKE